MRTKYKVLIGSPIRQEPKILKEFLQSISELERDHIRMDYYFIDDNEKEQSKKILKEFSSKNRSKIIIVEGNQKEPYICTEDTHQWREKLIWEVADYKNKIIEYCKKNFYDYLFLIDSDIVLHPKTLKHLISTKKDIISEIFWTKWRQDSVEMPQVWLYDQYNMTEQNRDEKLTKEEGSIRINSFIEKLKKPGIYKVGGLGACTLISKKAIQRGVNFREIYNLSFWGEDRHFSIRATALGFQLYVDTTYPAYHIYRQSDLGGVQAYKKGISTLNVSPQIKHLIKDFIEKYLSCDYRIVTGYEGLSYLSPLYVQKTVRQQDAMINYFVQNKIRCTAIPLNIDIDTKDETIIKAKISFVIKNMTEQGDEERQFSGNIHMKKYQNANWLIDHMSFENLQGKCILGFSLADILQGRERINKSTGNKVTLSMVVRNEANKVLDRVLSHAVQYVDNVIIIDDGSEDNTVEVCKQILKNIPSKVVCNKHANFSSDETSLRKQMWALIAETNPDWVLCLDADEIFEDKIINSIHNLINQSTFDYYTFRLYDMWDETHYREDTYWEAHKYYRTFLTRYQPNFEYTWYEMPHHSGRFPSNINNLNGCYCNIRLKHYGWYTESLRKEKYERYMKIDPEGKYGNMNQYRTILDPKPILKTFY